MQHLYIKLYIGGQFNEFSQKEHKYLTNIQNRKQKITSTQKAPHGPIQSLVLSTPQSIYHPYF